MKLNFKRELVEKMESQEPLDDPKLFMQDWLTMHNEIARYRKGLREAVDEIDIADVKPTGGLTWYGVKQILQKHFPELKED